MNLSCCSLESQQNMKEHWLKTFFYLSAILPKNRKKYFLTDIDKKIHECYNTSYKILWRWDFKKLCFLVSTKNLIVEKWCVILRKSAQSMKEKFLWRHRSLDDTWDRILRLDLSIVEGHTRSTCTCDRMCTEHNRHLETKTKPNLICVHCREQL